jgi:hypothetical protein
MDWQPIINMIVAAAGSLILGYVAAVKGALPKMLDLKVAKREAELKAERDQREAKIREEAEAAAYERNRRATREDLTFDLLKASIETSQSYIDIFAKGMEAQSKILSRMELQLDRENRLLQLLNGNLTGVYESIRSMAIQQQITQAQAAKAQAGATHEDLGD